MNQDCLEKFFGIIRQVAGPNDHPSTPTYLQLYRILSVYSLIKPPKTGNCTILEENIPVITINDIRQIINQENKSSIRQEKVLKLKNKIDTIIEEGVWDFDDIFQEHNYFNRNSTVFDCVVYFLSG
ncbi:uncharacterized protein LOC111026719 [Myzus persicae]|uniref:uncharacterized protein LOC111026719 n=1 Tax=Myzus persicae TaxID=13164 RepID=UPI000B93631B|nr:uncharacterized protein LOC111026719 [Myzus persicae]